MKDVGEADLKSPKDDVKSTQYIDPAYMEDMFKLNDVFNKKLEQIEKTREKNRLFRLRNFTNNTFLSQRQSKRKFLNAYQIK